MSNARSIYQISTDDKCRWSWEGGQYSKMDIVLSKAVKSLTVESIRRQIVSECDSFAGLEAAVTNLVHAIQLVLELYRL